tara:strand:- start:676 stop:1233 length:558 start_codon:yes stop_codon:yes gene_type:complete
MAIEPMPPKKRQKRNPPEIDHYERLSFLAREMAKQKKQMYQYNMLLKQVYDLIGKKRDSADFTDEMMKNLLNGVQEWCRDLIQAKSQSTSARDKAMKTIRQLDILDDDALKGAALMLSEEETRLAAIEGLQLRFYRIVRFKQSPIGIEKHTHEWFVRFLRQWKKTASSIEDHYNKLKEIVNEVSL